MSKLSKVVRDAVGVMVAGGDGVTVIHEGANLQVQFGKSNTMVSKIKSIDDAVFDEQNEVWNVPETSAEKLCDVVADMRDFVHNNNVQVKDSPLGKQVFFDYSKELAKVIGEVDLAKYDTVERVWNIPANSKALLVKEGEPTSWLDAAVSKMRGIVIEQSADMQNIMELATASASSRGVKPGIHFPVGDHSYTGPILNVNGNFAAQLSGTDEKNGVGFITIHKLANLGKPVFKGDDLRIDYDDKRKVSHVRSTAIFQQQQKEREALTSLAGGLVDGASVWNASKKDGAKHIGTAIEVTDHFVLQHGGRNYFKIHGRDALDNTEISKGKKLEISYKNSRGTVVDLDKQRTAAGVGR